MLITRIESAAAATWTYSRRQWSLVALLTALTVAFATGTASAATINSAAPRHSVSLMEVAAHIKAVDPALRESTAEIAAHVSSLQRNLRKNNASRMIERNAAASGVTTNLNYWGGTWWFHRVDVAWMATLSTAAVVAVLVYTCGIGVGAAWGMVGVLIGVFWGAVWAGRCVYLTPRPFHTGSYAC